MDMDAVAAAAGGTSDALQQVLDDCLPALNAAVPEELVVPVPEAAALREAPAEAPKKASQEAEAAAAAPQTPKKAEAPKRTEAPAAPKKAPKKTENSDAEELESSQTPKASKKPKEAPPAPKKAAAPQLVLDEEEDPPKETKEAAAPAKKFTVRPPPPEEEAEVARAKKAAAAPQKSKEVPKKKKSQEAARPQSEAMRKIHREHAKRVAKTEGDLRMRAQARMDVENGAEDDDGDESYEAEGDEGDDEEDQREEKAVKQALRQQKKTAATTVTKRKAESFMDLEAEEGEEPREESEQESEPESEQGAKKRHKKKQSEDGAELVADDDAEPQNGNENEGDDDEDEEVELHGADVTENEQKQGGDKKSDEKKRKKPEPDAELTEKVEKEVLKLTKWTKPFSLEKKLVKRGTFFPPEDGKDPRDEAKLSDLALIVEEDDHGEPIFTYGVQTLHKGKPFLKPLRNTDWTSGRMGPHEDPEAKGFSLEEVKAANNARLVGGQWLPYWSTEYYRARCRAALRKRFKATNGAASSSAPKATSPPKGTPTLKQAWQSPAPGYVHSASGKAETSPALERLNNSLVSMAKLMLATGKHKVPGLLEALENKILTVLPKNPEANPTANFAALGELFAPQEKRTSAMQAMELLMFMMGESGRTIREGAGLLQKPKPKPEAKPAPKAASIEDLL